LEPAEVGKEIAGHAKHRDQAGPHERRDRLVSIAEAVLLSLVAVTAAWSGYAAAKWTTESRVVLAKSSTVRTKANRADLEALSVRNFDSTTFGAWFTAYTARNAQALEIAQRRFRPEFRIAFDAWRATKPETNPHAPPGPTYMPQYKQPGLAKARVLDRRADDAFADGQTAGETADKYVRTTVFLASVLFLVGISTQFPARNVRYALIAVGVVLLVFSIVQLAQLPGPPG
jgi:hypothetical protein